MKKLPNFSYGDVVVADWVDTKSLLGWTYAPSHPRSPGRIRSIGYVVQFNNECLTITTSMDAKGASLDDLSIPVGCIKTLDVLEGYGFKEGR